MRHTHSDWANILIISGIIESMPASVETPSLIPTFFLQDSYSIDTLQRWSFI